MTWPGSGSQWESPPQPAPISPPTPPGRLVPLRVMQIIEVGTIAFRRHWRPLVAGTALIATIPVILSDVAQLRFGDAAAAAITLDANGLPEGVPSDKVGELVTAAALVFATELLASAFLTLASLLASVYVARDYRGESSSLSSAFRQMARRAPVALTVWLLVTLITIGVLVAAGLLAALAVTALPPEPGAVGGAGAFLALIAIVGGIVGFALLSIRLLVAPVAAVLEPEGPVRCLRRSWHLTGDNAWRSFGLVVLVTVTVSVIVAVIAQFVGLIADALVIDSGIRQLIGVACGLALGLFTAPILPVMETVLYFDLRVRRDGLTLSLPVEAAEGPAV